MTDALPRRTYLYFAAQSINLTAAVMSVTMAAIVGSALAPSAAWATVPYGCQFLFVLLATYPAARLMASIGRKKAFLLGAIPLWVAGVTGYLALAQQQFGLLVLSHAALGVYIAFANFNRFAATDHLPPSLKPRALSLVVAGGVLAAVFGPLLTEALRGVVGFPVFSLCYAAFIGLAMVSALLAVCLPTDAPQPVQRQQTADAAPDRRVTPDIAVAMAVAGIGYGVMNLLMIQASMHMRHLHADFADIRLAIQWHVIAMFAPSFFTGQILRRLGIKTTLHTGFALLLGCMALNLAGGGHGLMTLSLVVLGLGWNLTYVGGGALLTQALHGSPVAFQVQGKNDLVIALSATVGAFAPSLLFSSVGWGGTNVVCLVLCVAVWIAMGVGLSKGRQPRPATS
ncbi:MFS transporter [Pseudomonas monteilii]